MAKNYILLMMGTKQELVKVGDKVEVEPVADNGKTIYKVMVGDEHVGFLSDNENTLSKVPNTQAPTSKVGFSVIVKKEVHAGIQTFAKFMVSEVIEKNSKSIGSRKIEFQVRGALCDHPGKKYVLQDYLAGKEVVIDLALNDAQDDIVMSYQKVEGTIGEIVRNEEDEQGFQTILQALKSMTLTGTIAGRKGKGSDYLIEVEVDQEELEAAITGVKIEKVTDVVNRLKTDKVTSADTLKEIVAYLQSQGIDSTLIKAVLNRHKVYDAEFVSYISEKPRTPYIDKEHVLPRIISYVLGGTAVRLNGDASTGKNVLLDTLSWVFQTPLFQKPVSAQIDKFDLLGSKTVNSSVDENGNQLNEVAFEEDLVLKAMRCGGFYNLDEVNLGPSEVLELLNSVLDYRKAIDVSNYKRVVAAEGFNAFATMNPSNYVGTRELNEAFASRFMTIVFGPADSIIDLLEVHDRAEGVSKENIGIVNQVYQAIYNLVKNKETVDAKALSFRLYAEAAHYSQNPYIGIRESLIDSVANILDDVDQRSYVIDAIDAIC